MSNSSNYSILELFNRNSGNCFLGVSIVSVHTFIDWSNKIYVTDTKSHQILDCVCVMD